MGFGWELKFEKKGSFFISPSFTRDTGLVSSMRFMADRQSSDIVGFPAEFTALRVLLRTASLFAYGTSPELVLMEKHTSGENQKILGKSRKS